MYTGHCHWAILFSLSAFVCQCRMSVTGPIPMALTLTQTCTHACTHTRTRTHAPSDCLTNRLAAGEVDFFEHMGDQTWFQGNMHHGGTVGASTKGCVQRAGGTNVSPFDVTAWHTFSES